MGVTAVSNRLHSHFGYFLDKIIEVQFDDAIQFASLANPYENKHKITFFNFISQYFHIFRKHYYIKTS
jgi:hypothetical protein